MNFAWQYITVSAHFIKHKRLERTELVASLEYLPLTIDIAYASLILQLLCYWFGPSRALSVVIGLVVRLSAPCILFFLSCQCVL